MAVTDGVQAVLFGAFAFVTGVAGILNQNASSAFLPAVGAGTGWIRRTPGCRAA